MDEEQAATELQHQDRMLCAFVTQCGQCGWTSLGTPDKEIALKHLRDHYRLRHPNIEPKSRLLNA